MIRVSDIAARHPIDLHCITDVEYVKFANQIVDLLPYFDSLDVLEKIAVDIALYFEDINSGTHQMEVFSKIYKEWFGMYMPFYASEDASSPSAELDALSFVVWLSCNIERNGRIMNPMNEDLLSSTKKILKLWKQQKKSLPANNQLLDYIFSEEIFENPTDVRNVLAWIESRSYMGRWFTNLASLKDDEYGIQYAFKSQSKYEKQYQTECLGAFAHPAGPLSLPATHIYAEMIRMDINDPNDQIAADVEQMESEPFGLFPIVNYNQSGFTLKNFKDDTFFLPYFSKEQRKLVRRCNCLLAGLYRYRGVWYINGLSQWFNNNESRVFKEKYEQFIKEKKRNYYSLHNYSGQFDDFIAANGGERLYFFKNFDEYMKWSEKEFGCKNKLEQHPKMDTLMVFIEPCGQMSLSTVAEYINHHNNPYFNPNVPKNTLFTPIASESVSPDLVLYLIEHDLLSHVGFNDFRGKEHGRLLFQDNIDFMVRCFRRDIVRTDIYHKRNRNIFDGFVEEKPEKTKSTKVKKTFSSFLDEIRERKEFYSRGNVKLWRLVSCSEQVITITNDSRDKIYAIPSQKLFEAYEALEEKQYKISNLVPYVGKRGAAPATALLYSMTNFQTNLRLLRQLTNLLMKLE